ncbi:hypothetical protein KSP40_PGU001004 [Platanthera guangdongensis]|uniref:Uncharacterized protein n=1 Tax=Platanthera guangdongensis TaxID=2320717 RepID=A0ABR2M2E4_9ASPA
MAGVKKKRKRDGGGARVEEEKKGEKEKQSGDGEMALRLDSHRRNPKTPSRAPILAGSVPFDRGTAT